MLIASEALHAGGQLIRRLEYVTPVKKNRLGPKEAWCFEQQICSTRGAAGFVVTIEAHTPKVSSCQAYLHVWMFVMASFTSQACPAVQCESRPGGDVELSAFCPFAQQRCTIHAIASIQSDCHLPTI